MGVSQLVSSLIPCLMLTIHSITKLMGDSFRHHAQALIGYEDDIEISDVSTPSMISQGADDNEDSVY